MERKLYQGREWMLEDPEFMLRLEDFIHGFPIAIFLIGILIYKCTREPVDDGIDDLEPNEPVDPPTPVRTPSSTENASPNQLPPVPSVVSAPRPLSIMPPPRQDPVSGVEKPSHIKGSIHPCACCQSPYGHLACQGCKPNTQNPA